MCKSYYKSICFGPRDRIPLVHLFQYVSLNCVYLLKPSILLFLKCYWKYILLLLVLYLGFVFHLMKLSFNGSLKANRREAWKALCLMRGLGQSLSAVAWLVIKNLNTIMQITRLSGWPLIPSPLSWFQHLPLQSAVASENQHSFFTVNYVNELAAM